jgi:hypothetical protein
MCTTDVATAPAEARQPIAEVQPTHTGAAVLLDIGEGHGALVIYPDERYRGHEIEISRAEGDGRRVHTGVHDRSTQNALVLTAVFGSLPAGRYQIWADATTPGPIVDVPEARVAEVALR